MKEIILVEEERELLADALKVYHRRLEHRLSILRISRPTSTESPDIEDANIEETLFRLNALDDRLMPAVEGINPATLKIERSPR